MAGTVRFAPALVTRTPLENGGFVLRSPRPLGEVPRSVSDVLVRWAKEAPDRTFLAERTATGAFRTVSYRETLAAVRVLGHALLAQGLSASRPLLILSGNAIDQALLTLAAMHVGVPVAPVSPAYSLVSKDFAKLKTLVGILEPGALYAAEGPQFDAAIAAIGAAGLHVPRITVPSDVTDADVAAPLPDVDQAFARLTPDTIAKVLFTSGSTGSPKGVVNTQRMLCSNQQAIAHGWPFLAARPPVVVDWLPWSHTFGGNHNFLMVLWHGGTLYIDEGKPAPVLFDATVRNLREVSPTVYFNVPRGFDMLVAQLEQDESLAKTFFAELDLLMYAAAALSQPTWERLEAVSVRTRGSKVAMVSAWGSTETSPMVTQVHFPIDRAGVIGLPAPGCELSFVPVGGGDKLEMRVKGPNVSPGYWRAGGGVEPSARDVLGFYPMGDAGRLDDEQAPERGVVFDGRTAENFKLTSGTWVHVGELRIALVGACAPLLQDAVITGHDRDTVGALLIAGPEGQRHPALAAELERRLTAFNAARAGSSTQVTRVLVLEEPPSIDGGEITDKGYINQRAVLERRSALVAHLYADGAGGSDVSDVSRHRVIVAR